MRITSILVPVSLLVGEISAQCLDTTGGSPAGLVAYTTYPAHDEGRTPPIDMMFGAGGFPMAGVAGPLTHASIESNGVIFLTSGGPPVGTISYGPGGGLANLRGIAGDSPRVFPMWHDVEGPAATWAVKVDTSVPGRFRVIWVDVEEYGSSGPTYSFSASLYDTGVVEYSYSALPALPIDPILPAFTGISIGNGVGTGAEASVDLTSNPDSGSLGLLYQQFLGTVPSISGRTITLIPNGSGGYTSLVTCDAASNEAYGLGCYVTQSTSYQLFDTAPAAKASLDGNGMLWVLGAGGYTPTFIPGYAAAFVPPSGAATTLTATNDGNQAIVTSVAVPIPGGSTANWNVSANGILTAAATANNVSDWTPTGPELTGTAAANLGFYVWHDYNALETGSGPVQYEEVANTLYVTWNGVECYGTPSPNLATWQFQVDMTTGNVAMVWVSMNPATVAAASGDDTLVGCTLAGSGPDMGSQSLIGLPTVGADAPGLTLAAAPAPVINPSTLVTYTATSIPEFAPGAGVYISTMFLSVAALPGGIDLGFLGAPGCSAYIGSLDIDLGGQATFAPTASWNVLYDNSLFAPGNVVAAQAVSLIVPNSLPNGQNAFGMTTSNGVLSTTFPF